MNKSKFLATFVLGASLLSSTAFATAPYYGKPQQNNAKSVGGNAYVTVYNYTNASYMVNANYQCYPGYPCSAPTSLPIYAVGSPYSVITYPINFPDTQVCLFIPGVYSGCLSSGNLNIGPYRYGTKSPSVNITQ